MNDDPAVCAPSRTWIQKGVPQYNGVVARCIRDGHSNFTERAIRAVCSQIPSAADFDSELAVCAYNVTSSTPLLSTADEDWRMNHRFLQQPRDAEPLSIGYEFLAETLNRVYRVSECAHSYERGTDRERQLTELKETPALTMVKGFYFEQMSEGPRIYVAQTYGNGLARWLTLAGCRASQCKRLIVLRTDSVCLQCFIDHACKLEDEGSQLYLIL